MATGISGPWYHGTFTPPPDGEPFYPFTHLGTRETALDLLTDRYCLDHVRGTPLLYTFEVPPAVTFLDYPDFDSPDPRVWIMRLQGDKDRCFFPSIADYRELAVAIDRATAIGERHSRDCFGRWLAGQGYEGVRYINDHEGVGTTSIALADSSSLTLVMVEEVDMEELRQRFEVIKERPKYRQIQSFPAE